MAVLDHLGSCDSGDVVQRHRVRNPDVGHRDRRDERGEPRCTRRTRDSVLDVGLRQGAAQRLRLGARIASETERPELLDAAILHLLGPEVEECSGFLDATGPLRTGAFDLQQLLTFQARQDAVRQSH